MTAEALYSVRDLVVRKRNGGSTFELIVPHLVIRRDELVAITGASGCGKSTLLDVLALAAPVTSVGEFIFSPGQGQRFDLTAALAKQDMGLLTSIRRHYLGYVLQTGGLLPYLTIGGNLGLPAALSGRKEGTAFREIAERLGLTRHLSRKPAGLSIGERQRAAIGRALSGRPMAVLADEPTAALDPINASIVFDLLVEQVRMQGCACIVATHDWERVERLELRRLLFRVESLADQKCTRSTIVH